MKIILALVSFALLFPPVSSAEAAQCYWTACGSGCKSGYKYEGLSKVDTKYQCKEKRCCKMSGDEQGLACRKKCANKPAAYNGYFQCMDKCLGRKR